MAENKYLFCTKAKRTRSSAVTETARRFGSLNIAVTQGHSRSLESNYTVEYGESSFSRPYATVICNCLHVYHF